MLGVGFSCSLTPCVSPPSGLTPAIRHSADCAPHLLRPSPSLPWTPPGVLTAPGVPGGGWLRHLSVLFPIFPCQYIWGFQGALGTLGGHCPFMARLGEKILIIFPLCIGPPNHFASHGWGSHLSLESVFPLTAMAATIHTITLFGGSKVPLAPLGALEKYSTIFPCMICSLKIYLCSPLG